MTNNEGKTKKMIRTKNKARWKESRQREKWVLIIYKTKKVRMKGRINNLQDEKKWNEVGDLDRKKGRQRGVRTTKKKTTNYL